ncbi:trehalose-phosphatase [Erythrobacter crassostreae]|uniref:Trehalose 6-phosphate phosphatase n=1 Tax=Erythrobacter crassostreae TaxID=2828328 RepID=A0A9X1F419_9SPHN|nr:trehalose-phosphatase [Erythrobacter crassostrea]MBV7259712.1 trehalose-phosphatase [Erythrobacter crassostrea]
MVSGTATGAPPPLASLMGEGPVSLFLDFDGTLVELAPGPDEIKPRAGLASELGVVSTRLDGRCAIVSGRGLDDIEKHIGPLPVAGAGSHGSDVRAADGTQLGDGAIGLPAAIEQRLRVFAADNALDYEHKPHGGALHYRSNQEAGPAAHAFAKQLADENGWAAQSGKCVVEIVAKSANKGAAVRAFLGIAPFAGSRPFFLGDDLTDEAGFAACIEAGGAGILIGDREETIATYRLPNVTSVHEWLNL